MSDWWAEEDKEAFNSSTRTLANQFDSEEVMPGLHINGNLTLGENIAELGGLIIAYHAYRLYHLGSPIFRTEAGLITSNSLEGYVSTASRLLPMESQHVSTASRLLPM